MNSELKACPFCGGNAAIRKVTRRGGGGCDLYEWRVYCTGCGVETQTFADSAIRDDTGIRLTIDGRAEVIKAWEKRSAEDAPANIQKAGTWLKKDPNPEAMKEFHDKGLAQGMGVNSVFWVCSVCGNWGTPTHKYCNECGTRMKKVQK